MILSTIVVMRHTRPVLPQAALAHLESIIYNPFDRSQQQANGVEEAEAGDEHSSEGSNTPHR